MRRGKAALECVRKHWRRAAPTSISADPESHRPLLSLRQRRFDVAAYLIKKGANVNKWDCWGQSPLYAAVDVNTIPHGGRPDRPSLDETTESANHPNAS